MNRPASTLLSLTFAALARLPLGMLYGGADVLAAIAYHVVRYRRRLVIKNIAACFPDLGPAEQHRAVKQFYRNLADYFVETVKLGHISDEQMRRRVTFEGVDIIDDAIDRGKSVTVYFGHCFNWEWAPSVTLWSRHAENPAVEFCQVYRPLTNDFFDKWFLRLRSRFHSLSLPKASTFRDLLHMRRDGKLTVTGFMSDQKPSHQDPIHIIDFLGRPTDFITGTETLARKLDTVVVYWDMHKPKRGHYHIVTRLMSDGAAATAPGELTATYRSMLEETIRRNPAIWLWSHNRWKNVHKTPSK